ncbi:GNAT family N-acetyltransferase [Paenibacillus ginsengihumi]|nr:GNAT family N-acetyltransferase [Paenibacillus ginsengihumi]
MHREYQKQGVGQRIVEHLMDKLADVSCLHLISTSGNEAFYQKNRISG